MPLRFDSPLHTGEPSRTRNGVVSSEDPAVKQLQEYRRRLCGTMASHAKAGHVSDVRRCIELVEDVDSAIYRIQRAYYPEEK